MFVDMQYSGMQVVEQALSKASVRHNEGHGVVPGKQDSVLYRGIVVTMKQEARQWCNTEERGHLLCRTMGLTEAMIVSLDAQY
jgi:hypothetical protein